MKTGVIDVGGGLRDIYGAGVLDYCLDENIFLVTASAYRRAAPTSFPFWPGKKKEIAFFIWTIPSVKNI